jgi:hypothetical protein
MVYPANTWPSANGMRASYSRLSADRPTRIGASVAAVRVAFGERFDIRPGYLNTASIGVPSVNTADTLAETVTHWRTG